MIEFAIVLLVKRHSENSVSSKRPNTKCENKVGLGSERVRNPKHNMNNTDGITINATTQQHFSNQGLFGLPLVDAFFDSNEGFKQPEDLAGTRQDNSFKCSKLSVNDIDIAASILFPALYGMFNIIYWCYLM